jgi:hypothetical protein
MNKNLIGIGLVIGLFWFFFFRQADTWKGFYYPNKEDLTADIQSPIFDTLDQCREWVNTQVYKHNPNGGYDYECGKNCRFKSEYGVEVCKETVR